MSFGCSVGDFILLVQLAHKSFRNCQSAGDEYLEIACEVRCLHSVLRTLRAEAQRRESKIFKQDPTVTAQLLATADGCKNVLNNLDYILAKYEGLKVDGQTSASKKIWQKFRFGSKTEELGVIRGKLITYTSTISILIDTMQLQATDRVETKIDGGFAQLTGQFEKMRKEIYAIATQARAEERKGAAMSTLSLSTYAGDEKIVWQDFRRELVKKGFRSQSLEKYKQVLLAYMVKLDESGLLDQNDSPIEDVGKANQWWSKRIYMETINSLADLQVTEETRSEEQAVPGFANTDEKAIDSVEVDVAGRGNNFLGKASEIKEKPLIEVTEVSGGEEEMPSLSENVFESDIGSISDYGSDFEAFERNISPTPETSAPNATAQVHLDSSIADNENNGASGPGSRNSLTAEWLSTRVPHKSRRKQRTYIYDERGDESSYGSEPKQMPYSIRSIRPPAYVKDEDEERSLYEFDSVDNNIVLKINREVVDSPTGSVDQLGTELMREVSHDSNHDSPNLSRPSRELDGQPEPSDRSEEPVKLKTDNRRSAPLTRERTSEADRNWYRKIVTEAESQQLANVSLDRASVSSPDRASHYEPKQNRKRPIRNPNQAPIVSFSTAVAAAAAIGSRQYQARQARNDTGRGRPRGSKYTTNSAASSRSPSPMGNSRTPSDNLRPNDSTSRTGSVSPIDTNWDTQRNRLRTTYQDHTPATPTEDEIQKTRSGTKTLVGFTSYDEIIEEDSSRPGDRAKFSKRGILRQPTARFPEDPNPIREGIAPLKDARSMDGIPPDARWTKISRKLVSREVLDAEGERYEVQDDCFIVLRVLNKEDVGKYAEMTQYIRATRGRNEPFDEESYLAGRNTRHYPPVASRQEANKGTTQTGKVKYAHDISFALAVLGALAGAGRSSSPKRGRRP